MTGRWPLLVLIAVPLLTFWDVLFRGFTLYPADVLHELYLPFAAHHTNTNVQVTAVNDYLAVFYPLRAFVAEAFRDGRLPLWNPYIWGGSPALANNGSVVTLDPFNALYLVFGLPAALAWRAVLQDVCCALFMFAYLRHLKLERAAAVLGALAFALNSMFYATPFDWSLEGILWLPFMLLILERAMELRTPKSVLAAGLVSGVAFLASPLQFGPYLIGAVVTLTGILWVHSGRSSSDIRGAGAVLVAALLIGVLIYAVQLIPTLELFHANVRQIPWTNPRQPRLLEMALRTAALVTFIIPPLGGRLKDGMMLAEAWKGTTQFQGYIGVVSFVMATVGATVVPFRHTRRFLIVGLGCVFAILYTALGALLYERFFIIYIFAACVLAAMGVDALMRMPVCTRALRRLLGLEALFFAAIAVGTAVWGFVYWRFNDAILTRADAYLIAGLPVRYFGNFVPLHLQKMHRTLEGLTITSPGIYLLLAVGFVSLMLVSARARGRLTSTQFTLLVLPVAAAELVFSAWSHVPFVNLETYPLFPPTPALERIQEDPDLFRVITIRTTMRDPPLLAGGMLTPYRLQSSLGKDHLYPQNLFTILPDSLTTPDVDPLPQDLRILDVENTKYVIVGPHTSLPTTQFELIYDDDVRVYLNRHVMPRAFFLTKYVVYPEIDAARAFFRSERFNPHEVVILDRQPELARDRAVEHRDPAVRITNYQSTRVEVDADVAEPGLLMLSDTKYPGWEARVDGRETEIIRANVAMRAVKLTSGRHRVEFVYNPRSFRLGLAVTVGAFLVALCGMLIAKGNEGIA